MFFFMKILSEYMLQLLFIFRGNDKSWKIISSWPSWMCPRFVAFLQNFKIVSLVSIYFVHSFLPFKWHMKTFFIKVTTFTTYAINTNLHFLASCFIIYIGKSNIGLLDKYSSKHEALLVWQPCTQKVSTEQGLALYYFLSQLTSCNIITIFYWFAYFNWIVFLVNQFCKLAKEKFKYSEEQALGMLLWHKHDADKATSQLANFIPFPDDWSSEDKVLFDQAYAFHGKSFYRIGEMVSNAYST